MMLLGPSHKPLSRVLVFGEEASSLLVLAKLQNASATHIDRLLDASSTCWWFWVEGENLRLYLLAPRSEETLLDVLGTQKFDVFLWVVERISASKSRERRLLRSLYLSKPSRVVVLLDKESLHQESIIRELLQEANLPANEAEIISNEEQLMSALEREVIVKPEATAHPFYMNIEQTTDDPLGVKAFGQTIGSPVSVGDSVELIWGNRLTNTTITTIEVCGIPKQQTIAGYPTQIQVSTRRGSWEAMLAKNFLVLTKEFTAEVYFFTEAQGGFRRSWSPGDPMELQLRGKILSTTLSAGMLRPGELRVVTFTFRSKFYLFCGERIFLLAGNTVLGVGVVQKIR
jgi:hypothetical protein